MRNRKHNRTEIKRFDDHLERNIVNKKILEIHSTKETNKILKKQKNLKHRAGNMNCTQEIF